MNDKSIASVVAVTVFLLFGCAKQNTPPKASFQITPEIGTTDTVFTFDAIGSTDVEDDPTTLQVHWDWTNDGIWDTEFSSNKTIKHRYTEAGIYTIVLEVKDSEGLVNSVTKLLNVGEKISAGTFIDSRDQHQYGWVIIGTQTWMAENLAFLPSVSPSDQGSDTDKHYYVYGYEGTSISEAKSSPNYAAYGALYNWRAATTACPAGWHLPSEEDWKLLERYLGMAESDINSEGWRSSGQVGKQLKSTTGWMNNGNGDNSSGFSALPGGCRFYEFGFIRQGGYSYFWSSTENGPVQAWIRSQGHSIDEVYRGYADHNDGFSVRCVKNG